MRISQTEVLSMMDVNLICNHNVATVGKNEGIADAAALMRAEHVGDLIVVEARGDAKVPVGILTDRDIVVGVIAKRIAPNEVTVGDSMTRNPLTVREDASVEFALREMRRHGVRRAPVVRANGDLVGVIAVDDIIQHLAVQLTRLADLIRLEQDAEQRTRP
jgi:CBS domain-containing protein